MKLNYLRLFDFVFPPTADEACIANKTPSDFAAKYAPRMVSNGVWALTSFKDPEVRAAIHLLKFHHHAHAIALLSSLLSTYLQTLPLQHYVLIPVPLSSARARERGFNQVAVLAQESLKDLSSFSLETRVLAKIRDTKPQSSLGKKERLKNVSGAFVLNNTSSRIEQKHVILLDDVLTTGSTLAEAKKALASAEPLSITCVALAH